MALPKLLMPSPLSQRLTLLVALSHLVLGGFVLYSGLSANSAEAVGQDTLVPLKLYAGAGILFLGVIFLLIELEQRWAAWLATLPALTSLVLLLEVALKRSLGAGHLLQTLAGGSATPDARMPVLLSSALLAASAAILTTLSARFAEKLRSPLIALMGSPFQAIGFAILLGTATQIPLVYDWQTSVVTALVIGATLLLTSSGLGMLAWRASSRANPAAPVWVPLPVVVVAVTFTLIIATSFRDREAEFYRSSAQNQINLVASTINADLERIINSFGRAARRWSDSNETIDTTRVRELVSQMEDTPGRHTLAVLDASRQTLFGATSENHATRVDIPINHDLDPVRSETLDESGRSLEPGLTGTLRLGDPGLGFAVYAPLVQDGKTTGYIAGDFSYRAFFNAIERRLKLSGTHHSTILVGNERVFDGDEGAIGRADAVERVFSLHGRRVQIAVAPNLEYQRLNRRHLPELALGAGLGISLLLGLSVHFARTSSSGLRAAQTFNKRLMAENEERRRIEAMLKVSDERLRLAIESTEIGIFEWQQAEERVFFSPGVWTILGYDPAAQPLSLEIWTQLVHPEDRERYQRLWRDQLIGKISYVDPEYRVRAADGSWRWLYVRSRGFASPGGPRAPVRIVGTIQDVSERKRADQALRESQSTTRKLSLVASRTDNLVIIAGANGSIEWVNESFVRVMEYSLEEITGKGPDAFLRGPDADTRILRRVRTAIERGESLSIELANYSKSGRKYFVHLEIQPIRNERGELENFIAIETDITARVETENALRRAKLEADAASRTKSEFLASMSHEIRTPMNGVIGMTSLLLETPLKPEQRDYLATIRTSGEALLTIINDILDFSKIESGKMDLELQPVDLSTCIEETLDLFAVPASAKKLELTYCIHEGVPNWIIGDVTRLRQILSNLINNAVKFTSSGSVSIEVRHTPKSGAATAEPPATLGLEFAVRDTGIGIPPDRIERLFKPFSQVDSSTTRKYGGTGLGLAICQRLATLMGGGIRVESEVGRGSTFIASFRTAVAPAPEQSADDGLGSAFRGETILCIEDQPVTQRRLQRFLREQGTKPVAAATVEDALKAVFRPERPAAVVLDLAMIDEAKGPYLRDHLVALQVPIVLLLPPGQSSALLLGDQILVETLAKPLKTQTLATALRRLGQAVPRRELTASPSPAPATATLPNHPALEILVVEDNPVNQKVALRYLEKLGFRAATAENGVLALATLEKRNFHLILMDLQMPEMDGFETCRQIRKRFAASRQPKIIALTANALKGDRELCLEAGMDDYLTKPVKIGDIAAAIEKHFGHRPSERLATSA
jgi:PAS domain S-box-containing protein